jgi:hypothetical protein
MPYYVKPPEMTCAEPASGWFYEDKEGVTHGPFPTRTAALDDETDGHYSDWLYEKHRDEKIDYRQDMIDAGRGHLLRDDD